MSMQPNPPAHDLDRTDELPRLDVAAYEASLAAAEANLSSTDTWNVQALREAEDLHDPVDDTTERSILPASSTPSLAPPPDVTVDAERILGRIRQLEVELADLEAQNAAVHEQEDELRAVIAERDERLSQVEAENRRLREQHAIDLERMQALQAQVASLSVQLESERGALTAAQQSERAAAQEDREQLLRQVQSLREELAVAQHARAHTDESLQTLQAQVTAQTQSVVTLEHELEQERDRGAQLGRYLAAKLVEYDALALHSLQRDQAIGTLLTLRESLEQQLQAARAQVDELTTQAQADQQLGEQLRMTVSQHVRTIEELERRVTQLNADLEQTVADFGATTQERNAGAEALAAERRAHEDVRRALAAREAELEQAQAAIDSLSSKLAALDAELQQARNESQSGVEQIVVLHQQVEMWERQSTALQADLASARAHVEQLEREVQQLAAVRGTLADQEARWAAAAAEAAEAQRLMQEFQAIDAQRAEQLVQSEVAARDYAAQLQDAQAGHAALQAELERVQAAMATLETQMADERARTAQLTAGLEALRVAHEQADVELAEAQAAAHSQAEQAAALGAELQAAHDERDAVALRLARAKERNKTLAQEVFTRDRQIGKLRQELAVHVETLAAIRQDVNRITEPGSESGAAEPERILEPLGHEGPPILLNRKLITIGRTSDNDACIPSKLVSRHHARLLVGPNAVIVEDAGSTNGCYVNDRLVRQQLMREGDVLALGDLRYRLTVRAPRGRLNAVPVIADSVGNGLNCAG